MTTKVIMPQLGESVVEGTVSKWLKHEGDRIEEYEALLEVSTDKVDTEVPAPAAGVILKIHVHEGETVDAGTLLAEIGEEGDQLQGRQAPTTRSAEGAGNGHQKPEPTTVAQSATTGHITPVVARMASEHELDLSQIAGSGRGGRITKRDVESYLETHDSATTLEAQPDEDDATPAWERPMDGDLFKPTVEYDDSPTQASPAKTAVQTATPKRTFPVEPVPDKSAGELVQLTPMRKAIAEHMVFSKLQTAPHVTTVFEVDLSAVLAHRGANKEAFAKQGVNLTLTAYFAAATVRALQTNPYLNAQWTKDGVFLHYPVHLGMAVAVEGGLIVPVIRNAHDLNLLGMARAVNDVAIRARSKQLKPDEVQGGTFTISNHGVSGSLFATPIINQPQVGILGVGMMEKRVKVINDMLAIRPCCYLSLTFDHRVADGSTGDSFMLTLKEHLENWA